MHPRRYWSRSFYIRKPGFQFLVFKCLRVICTSKSFCVLHSSDSFKFAKLKLSSINSLFELSFKKACVLNRFSETFLNSCGCHQMYSVNQILKRNKTNKNLFAEQLSSSKKKLKKMCCNYYTISGFKAAHPVT